MVGEMEKPVMIGKAAKPRCFKNLKINNLPVIWRNNKKALMTMSYNGRVQAACIFSTCPYRSA
jgi:hypothetical protein